MRLFGFIELGDGLFGIISMWVGACGLMSRKPDYTHLHGQCQLEFLVNDFVEYGCHKCLSCLGWYAQTDED